MEAVNPRDDWPFGPELKQHREDRGLSVKAAARRTNGALRKVSDGRWYQLESGYQQIKGQYIPIGTTAATVAAVAQAVDWDVREALKIAGFSVVDVPDEKPSPLQNASVDDLLAEVRRRIERASVGGSGSGDELKDHALPGSVATLVGVPVPDDPAMVRHEESDERDEGRGT